MRHASRPVFLDPTQLQMPVGALSSILHRVSGILLASGVPFGVYLLDRSLRDEQGFAEVMGLLEHGVKAAAGPCCTSNASPELGKLAEACLPRNGSARSTRLIISAAA